MNNNVHRPYINKNIIKKDYLKSLLYKSIFVLVVILLLLLVKSLNTDSTNNFIKIVEKNLNYEFNIVEDGKKIYYKAKSLMDKSVKTIEVFGTSKKAYESPIDGTIKNRYGDKIKVNGIVTENTGVEIQAKSDENPICIINGKVTKIERIDKKGYFVTMKNDEIEIVYGYINEVNVKEGDQVQVGHSIGELGVNRDGQKYLRVEVYIDGINVDPNTYINF